MSNNKESAVNGLKLKSEEKFWLDLMRNETKASIGAVEEAAKQLITITSLLQTVYFAAISFSDLKKALVVHDLYGWFTVILFISPIILWLICLSFAIAVFLPKSYHTNLSSPSLASEAYENIITFKQRQLWRAYQALAIGFLPLIISIVVYLVWIHVPEQTIT